MGNAIATGLESTLHDDDDERDVHSSTKNNDQQHEIDNGIFSVQNELLTQEKYVAEMETSSLLLQEYHHLLDSVANQSMLLLGFVMATIGVDSLQKLCDPRSSFCFSKSNAHFVMSVIAVLSTELCVCFCMLCIAGSAYTVYVGRRAYLHIGW